MVIAILLRVLGKAIAGLNLHVRKKSPQLLCGEWVGARAGWERLTVRRLCWGRGGWREWWTSGYIWRVG